jgi:hypothetical protein
MRIRSVFLFISSTAILLFASGLGLFADVRLIQVQDGLLTLQVTGVALQEVLEEIVNQSDIEITIHGPLEKDVSEDFSGLSIEEGLKRLIRGYNHVFIYGRGTGADSQIKEVIIYAAEGERLDETTTTREVVPQTEESNHEKETSVESLIQALHDQDPAVRGEAITLLADMQEESALAHLVRILLNDRDGEVRQSAAMALGDLADERAIGALIQALRDPDAGVRESAVDALGEIGTEEAVTRLRAVLKDEDQNVREAAANALKDLSGEDQSP